MNDMNWPMVWMVLALVAVGAAISLPATAILCKLGKRLGTLDSTGADGHSKTLRSIPNIGGVGIFLAMALPLAGGLLGLLLLDQTTLSEWLPGVAEHLPRLTQGSETTMASIKTAWAMLGGMLVLHLLGLIDDRKSINPFVKLVIQIAVAATLTIWFDVRYYPFSDQL